MAHTHKNTTCRQAHPNTLYAGRHTHTPLTHRYRYSIVQEKVEVVVLGSPSVISPMVSADEKQQKKTAYRGSHTQKHYMQAGTPKHTICRQAHTHTAHTQIPIQHSSGESRGGCPGFPIRNKPDGFCGREATEEDGIPWLTHTKTLHAGRHTNTLYTGRPTHTPLTHRYRYSIVQEKVEVVVLGSPSVISPMVSADEKQQKKTAYRGSHTQKHYMQAGTQTHYMQAGPHTHRSHTDTDTA